MAGVMGAEGFPHCGEGGQGTDAKLCFAGEHCFSAPLIFGVVARASFHVNKRAGREPLFMRRTPYSFVSFRKGATA